MQGIAIGVIWVPLTLVTFSTISSANLAEGTAVYHLLRNIGSSFFISICVAEIVRATSANYAVLVEMVSPYNRSLALPWVTGGWDTQTVGGLASLSKEISRQAAMLGYINAFGFYTLCSALAIPADPVGRPPRPRALGCPSIRACYSTDAILARMPPAGWGGRDVRVAG